MFGHRAAPIVEPTCHRRAVPRSRGRWSFQRAWTSPGFRRSGHGWCECLVIEWRCRIRAMAGERVVKWCGVFVFEVVALFAFFGQGCARLHRRSTRKCAARQDDDEALVCYWCRRRLLEREAAGAAISCAVRALFRNCVIDQLTPAILLQPVGRWAGRAASQ